MTGGLILRYAVAQLYNPRASTIAGLTPTHFVTLATPHLGCDAQGEAQVSTGQAGEEGSVATGEEGEEGRWGRTGGQRGEAQVSTEQEGEEGTVARGRRGRTGGQVGEAKTVGLRRWRCMGA